MLEQSTLTDSLPIAVGVVARPGAPLSALGRRRFGVAFWLPAGWLALTMFFALFAGLLPLQNPTKIAGQINLMPFHQGHLLGTDYLGRDTFARLVFGSRVSLTVGIVAVGIGMAIGGLLGLLAGF